MYSYPNVTGVFGLVQWCNSVTNDWFIPLILIGLYVILFISFMGYSTPRAFGASSFICALIAVLFGMIGLLGFKFVTGFIILGAIGLIVLYASNHKEYG